MRLLRQPLSANSPVLRPAAEQLGIARRASSRLSEPIINRSQSRLPRVWRVGLLWHARNSVAPPQHNAGQERHLFAALGHSLSLARCLKFLDVLRLAQQLTGGRARLGMTSLPKNSAFPPPTGADRNAASHDANCSRPDLSDVFGR